MPNSFTGILNEVGAVASGVAGVASGLAALIGGAPAGSWLAQLLPASYRGLPFAVEREEVARGRRTALHTYPKRPDVWGEDMGRAARPFSLSGFVVGDDCFLRARAILAAAEAEGAGTLVHPWLGTFRVAQIAPVRAATRKDLGRVVELAFEFVETTDPVYPSSAANTRGQVATAAAGVTTKAGGDFGSAVAGALKQGASVVQAGAATVQRFVGQAQAVVGDASLVAHAVAGLAAPAGHTFGRFGAGGRSSLLSGISTAQGAIAAVSRARAAVTSAANSAAALADAL